MRLVFTTLLTFVMPAALAAPLQLSFVGVDGRGIGGTVVTLRSTDSSRPVAKPTAGVLDQVDRQFVPNVLVIPVGSQLVFPNSDSVSHQVYSFSPAKNFKLALYAGKLYPPLVFDKPGLVTLGCNIHDSMIGFVYVTDSPWFGKTGTQGRVDIAAVPPGDYLVRLWHPRFPPDEAQIERSLKVTATGDANLTVSLKRSLQPEPGNNTSNKWKGY